MPTPRTGSAAATILCLAALPFLSACDPDKPTGSVAAFPRAQLAATQPGDPRYQQLVDDIDQITQQEIQSLNTSVTVITPAIDRIVAVGPPIIPTLVNRMQSPGCDFDTFTRCYSAADQILRNAGMDGHCFWDHGVSTTPGPDGFVRLAPGGQTDLDQFRELVVHDIQNKYADLQAKKQK